jgi:hypothetical protein
MIQSDFLLLYVREDGIFARFLKEDRAQDREVRDAVSEESIRPVLKKLFLSLFPKKSLLPRSVTVVYVLSRRVEILQNGISDFFGRLSFVDSVTVLRRDEVFYRAARLLSEKAGAKKQVLYFDSREARLFTEEREWALPTPRSGGNGFLDFLIGFSESEQDSVLYFIQQIDRLTALFSAYRVFRRPFESNGEAQSVIFPKVKRGSALSRSPKRMEETAAAEELKAEDRTVEGKSDASDPTNGKNPQIRYFALSDSERERVNKKFPALYRTVHDKRGNYLYFTIEEVANAFKALFSGIEQAPLTDLTVVGPYADFPLLDDFLRSLTQRPRITYSSESRLVLDGLTACTLERIASSALSVSDMDGDPVVLWTESDTDAPIEKRVSFYTTLRRSVTAEEWRRRIPLLPYTLSLTETVRGDAGAYTRRRREIRADLREFCYQQQKDGSYLLSLPSAAERNTPYETVCIGLGATPDGVVCHLLGMLTDAPEEEA